MDEDILFQCVIEKPSSFTKTLAILAPMIINIEIVVNNHQIKIFFQELDTQGIIYTNFPKEKFKENDFYVKFPKSFSHLPFSNSLFPSSQNENIHSLKDQLFPHNEIENNNNNSLEEILPKEVESTGGSTDFDVPALFFDIDDIPFYSFNLNTNLSEKIKHVDDTYILKMIYRKSCPNELEFSMINDTASIEFKQQFSQYDHAEVHEVPKIEDIATNDFIIHVQGQALNRQLMIQNATETPFITVEMRKTGLELICRAPKQTYKVKFDVGSKLVDLGNNDNNKNEEDNSNLLKVLSNDFSTVSLQKYTSGYKVNKICCVMMNQNFLIINYSISTIGNLYFILSPYVHLIPSNMNFNIITNTNTSTSLSSNDNNNENNNDNNKNKINFFPEVKTKVKKELKKTIIKEKKQQQQQKIKIKKNKKNIEENNNNNNNISPIKNKKNGTKSKENLSSSSQKKSAETTTDEQTTKRFKIAPISRETSFTKKSFKKSSTGNKVHRPLLPGCRRNEKIDPSLSNLKNDNPLKKRKLTEIEEEEEEKEFELNYNNKLDTVSVTSSEKSEMDDDDASEKNSLKDSDDNESLNSKNSSLLFNNSDNENDNNSNDNSDEKSDFDEEDDFDNEGDEKENDD